MATIKCVKARQIFDSRGNPTVEADVCLSDGTFARASVPSGASTGAYEALELRDGGSDYLGKAVNNVNSIIGPALIGKDPTEQDQIDNFMVQQLDGTSNEWGWCKRKLGANAILAVSLAVCKAGASVKKITLYQHIANLAGNKNLVLPVPAFNVINGGSHAGNKLAMQEFMVLPVGASSFKEALKMGVEVYHHLKAIIKKKYGQDATNVGDEGGFAPNIQESKEGLELLKAAIAKQDTQANAQLAAHFQNNTPTPFSSFLFQNNDGSQKISGDSLKDVYKSFVAEYPIISIEDPFDQDDWTHYVKLTKEIGEQVQIVGDDLLVTNPKRVAKAIKEKACNALLLKLWSLIGFKDQISPLLRITLYSFGINSWVRCITRETMSSRASTSPGIRDQYKHRIDGRRKRVVKWVAWADEVGGALEEINSCTYEEDATVAGSGKNSIGEHRDGVNAKARRGKEREPAIDSRWVGRSNSEAGSIKSTFLFSGSYKEVLLRQTSHPPLQRITYRRPNTASRSHRRGANRGTAGRCFKCLASDHKVTECRDLVRCLRCRKSGHRAFHYKEVVQRLEDRMNRALRQRGRAPASKVFVQYSEEYLRRRELRRNAILADVIHPAELGPNPTSTIKNAIARRFGGYTDDFAVARYRERDYAIFLPEWVSAEVLVRREVLTLDGFRIRCFPWGH
uniref:phosphopyruvate hydratase n=1 Tax=Ananas comosus var. bracteatus TaxID=296719 RepID=A0A6V7PXP9_ANACO|nr:unnamed protein product [Ananas comosus var. bracteatus]